MLVLTAICQLRAANFIAFFTSDREVIAVGAEFLKVISLNFFATGVIFTCSSLFQGLGNTWPSLIAAATRLLTFVIPALVLSMSPHFHLLQVWYVSVASVLLQAALSLILLKQQFRARLKPARLTASQSVTEQRLLTSESE
jgi:Na+-driven multidrug efflux pump